MELKKVDSVSRFGRLVREARTEKGWNQRDLAEKSGVSQRYLSELENGKGSASLQRLFEVLRVLDVPLHLGVRS